QRRQDRSHFVVRRRQVDSGQGHQDSEGQLAELQGEDEKMKAAVPYEQGLDRDLQDPEFAAAYLTESFKSGKDVFLIALGDVVRARGDFKGFAASLGKARAALYRGLGSGGNPTMDTLMLVL